MIDAGVLERAVTATATALTAPSALANFRWATFIVGNTTTDGEALSTLADVPDWTFAVLAARWQF